MEYKAFISYSHSADGKLAPVLESALRRIGKPWYRPAPFQIFMDKSGLSANPGLRHSIEMALSQSEYFLMLASPAAAQSTWVERELEWWLEHRSVDKILILLTDGEVAWSDAKGDFDWDRTTALSPKLRGRYHEEPFYVDLRWARNESKLSLRQPRFRGSILDIAPPLYGKSKEQLDDEDVRHYRSARRAVILGALALTGLTAATGIAGYVARQDRNLADCRQLAGQAAGYMEDRLDLALLLGIESSRLAHCPEGRSALLSAVQYRPHLAQMLAGHTNLVIGVAYSPGGRMFASSSWDGSVRLWDSQSGKPLAPVLKGMYGLAFSPDGKLLATSNGEAIDLWNMPGGSHAGELRLRDRSLMAEVAFSPDGKTIATSTEATGQAASRVLLWDVATRQLAGPAMPGHRFAFSPDGKTLATDGEDGKSIVLLNWHTRRPIGPALRGHTGLVRCIAFSPDGQTLASGAEDHSILVWDLTETQSAPFRLTGHRGPVNSVVFQADGTRLASAGGDGNVILWDVEKRQAIGSPWAVTNKPVFGVAFAPDGRTLVSGSGDQRVVVWNAEAGPPLGRVFAGPNLGESNIAFSPDGRTLAGTDDYGQLTLWDSSGGTQGVQPEEGESTAVAYSPDGSVLATVNHRGEIAVRNPKTGEPVSRDKTQFRLWSIAFSPDGKTLAAGGDAVILLWDWKARRLIVPAIREQKDRIWGVAFSPNGRLLASAGNRSLGWWDARSGAPLSPPVVAAGELKYLLPAAAAFSPDGRLLAVRNEENGVVLWDVAHRRRSGEPLSGHTDPVTSIAFSPDGTLLATGGADGAAILWDVRTRKPVGRPFRDGAGTVSSVAFQPDGRGLAVVCEKRLVVWGIGEDFWSQTGCRMAGRNLTRGEWTQFFGSTPYRFTCGDSGGNP